MTEHTREPWHHNISAKYPIFAEQTPGKKDWRHIAGVLGRDEQAEADLRRIVACVNACAGIPTADLERVGAIAEHYPRMVCLAAIVQKHEMPES